MKIDEKSMKCYEQSMEIDETNHEKSMKIDEKSVKINETSMNIYGISQITKHEKSTPKTTDFIQPALMGIQIS